MAYEVKPISFDDRNLFLSIPSTETVVLVSKFHDQNNFNPNIKSDILLALKVSTEIIFNFKMFYSFINLSVVKIDNNW